MAHYLKYKIHLSHCWISDTMFFCFGEYISSSNFRPAGCGFGWFLCLHRKLTLIIIYFVVMERSEFIIWLPILLFALQIFLSSLFGRLKVWRWNSMHLAKRAGQILTGKKSIHVQSYQIFDLWKYDTGWSRMHLPCRPCTKVLMILRTLY